MNGINELRQCRQTMGNKLKKYKSKWFRIAVEGATTDGREIQRNWIEQMAAAYNPETYGARVNCEHIKSWMPRGEFGAYGDVLALKAEEVEILGAKKLALFAQIEPTEELIVLNKERQKIYTSIEVNPNFADSGKAYLVGLAVTDSPASLGTEALEFSAKSGLFSNRKQNEGNLFTAAELTELEFNEEQGQDSSAISELKTKIADLFRRSEKAAPAELFSQLTDAMTAALDKYDQEYSDLADSFAEQHAALETLQSDFDSLKTDFEELQADFSKTPSSPNRPAVTGGDGQIKTTF